MSVATELLDELIIWRKKNDDHDQLWKRYLELFKENTRLIGFITQKGYTMDNVAQTPGLVPEDPFSAQMAEANLDDGKVIKTDELPFEGSARKILKRFVQTEDMISGDPVVI